MATSADIDRVKGLPALVHLTSMLQVFLENPICFLALPRLLGPRPLDWPGLLWSAGALRLPHRVLNPVISCLSLP